MEKIDQLLSDEIDRLSKKGKRRLYKYIRAHVVGNVPMAPPCPYYEKNNGCERFEEQGSCDHCELIL